MKTNLKALAEAENCLKLAHREVGAAKWRLGSAIKLAESAEVTDKRVFETIKELLKQLSDAHEAAYYAADACHLQSEYNLISLNNS